MSSPYPLALRAVASAAAPVDAGKIPAALTTAAATVTSAMAVTIADSEDAR